MLYISTPVFTEVIFAGRMPTKHEAESETVKQEIETYVSLKSDTKATS